jgi:hypothetical protein
MVVHQAHDYLHVPADAGDVFAGPEARRNLKLAGGWKHIFTLNDATHVLRENKPRLAISPKHLQRRLITLPTLYSLLGTSTISTKSILLGFHRVWPSARKSRSA